MGRDVPAARQGREALGRFRLCFFTDGRVDAQRSKQILHPLVYYPVLLAFKEQLSVLRSSLKLLFERMFASAC